MLKACFNGYVNVADSVLGDIVDWRKEDKNTLCYKCCEYEGKDDKLFNGYLSALLVRYWQLIGCNYKMGKGVYGLEDCYNWLIDSVLGTIKAKSWLNPESSLYNDPIAPDKSINVRMKSHRQGFYQWSNKQKRAGEFTLRDSYEMLFDTIGESAFPIDEYKINEDYIEYIDIKNCVKSEFEDKNYVSSFMLHSIINYDVFDLVKEQDGVKRIQFNKKKLYSTLRGMDDKFGNTFSDMYEIDKSDVNVAIDSCSELSRIRLHNLIDKSIEKFSKKFDYLKK